MEKIEAGVNQVDTSKETVDQEWGEITTDENINPADETGMASEDAGQGSPAHKPEPDREETASKINGFLKRLFSFLFRRFAPGWNVTGDESADLSDAWSAVIAKYLPGRWLRFVPGGGALIELDAIMITIDIIEPRLKTPANSENNQEQAAPAVDSSKTERSEKPGKRPEPQSGVMKEVHET